MRNWLIAKAEEDKRLQEEEKTRQEELKLEQRKIEQSMLRDALASGVPLHLVPMIFAGIGGTLGSAGIEMAQQYLAQLQQATSHQQTVPSVANSELHREPRLIGQPHQLVSQHTVQKLAQELRARRNHRRLNTPAPIRPLHISLQEVSREQTCTVHPRL